jgi:F-type H+-transporting ATPase subunit delta
MAGHDDKTLAIARPYAEALLGLAQRAGAAAEVREELTAIEGLIAERPAFRDFLTNPGIDAGERRGSLERLFRGRASDLVVDALQVMNRKGRIALVPAVAAAYRAAHDRLERRVEVRVASAVPLDDEQRRRLAAAIESGTGLAPTLVERVDRSLVGGLVVTLGDTKIDASVASRLRKLSEALRARASRQLSSGSHVEGMVA